MTVEKRAFKFGCMFEKDTERDINHTMEYQTARAWLESQAEAILREQVEIARTPAPPFQEKVRGELIASKLRALNIANDTDAVGNILARCPQNGADTDSAPVVVAAHIDTVFGPETQIDVRCSGRRWIGPGIADNARGLAVAVSLLRALIRARAAPEHPILFAFTVGEEGSGDLRGVKHLFQAGSPLMSATAFIAIDGSGLRRIVHRALGSRRFRVTVRGPGGHSWADWGRANPAHVIGELTHRLADSQQVSEPKTTLTVARLGGGTSINAIPADSWAELDVRSESSEALKQTEALIRQAVNQSVAAEEGRTGGSLSVSLDIIGERPAGMLPTTHPLLLAASAATEAVGHEPEPSVSSTDANVPLALGIPAIAIGGGGRSGNAHTMHEWFEDTDGAAGALRALSLLAAIARF